MSSWVSPSRLLVRPCVPLTSSHLSFSAEKLQAISSPWGAWISSLESKHVHIENGLRELFQWDVARGRDFQNIAHLIYCCDKLENEDRQELPTASKIDVWLRRTDEPDPRFQKRINDVLDFMTYLAGRDARRDGLVNGFVAVGKRVAPVEFVFIGGLSSIQVAILD